MSQVVSVNDISSQVADEFWYRKNQPATTTIAYRDSFQTVELKFM